MKPLRLFLTAISLSLCSSPNLFGQWIEQTIPLRPGWNAVFLEVDPEPQDCEALVTGLQVESIWDFNASVDSPQFVQDPSTLIPNTAGWLTWFSANHPLATQRTLFSLRDGRPYLIKLADNAAPVNWSVKGRPSLRKTIWRPGGVNFVGFRAGTTAPTFQALFAGEAGLAGQPVYTLNTSGAWQQVANLSTTRPESGKAYWVRCIGPARRTATVEVEAGSRLGLRFGEDASELSLRVRNTSTSARNLTVRVLPSATPPSGQPPLAGPVPLEYWRSDYANTNLAWTPLPAALNFPGLPAGQEWKIRVGVRRSSAPTGAPGSQLQSVLEVTDDLGSRWLVPVSADTVLTAAAAGRPKTSHEAVPHAGLWVGEATFNSISQPANIGNPSLPRPAGGTFSFRLIVHVDEGGTARLLQRVYLVRKAPVTEPDPDNPGFNRIIEPARTVVATDEALIPAIVGNGQISGRRISSAAFAFAQPVMFGGGAFGAGTLTAAIALDYNHPLNPFKHVYHPDHNNLDERFEQTLPEGKESFSVTRALAMEFTATDPLGSNPPGWGDLEVGGIYRETISGLHRNAIQASGNFRLVRVTQGAALNQ